jgi:hypothetical protein
VQSYIFDEDDSPNGGERSRVIKEKIKQCLFDSIALVGVVGQVKKVVEQGAASSSQACEGI